MSETTPSTANRTLRRLRNADYRPREYLTETEVTQLIEAARAEWAEGCSGDLDGLQAWSAS
jgi:hypothetical protein